MHKMKNIISYILLTCLIISCKKDNNTGFSGTFIGTFTVKYANNSTFTGNTTVVFFENGQFTCTGNANFIPAGASGKFIKTDSKISFKDENFWTANFDGNLILNGDYDFYFDGKNLKLTATKNNAGLYEYNLSKQ